MATPVIFVPGWEHRRGEGKNYKVVDRAKREAHQWSSRGRDGELRGDKNDPRGQFHKQLGKKMVNRRVS